MNVINNQELNLGKYQKNIEISLKKLQEENFIQRLWKQDKSLWNQEKLKNEISTISLGWLDVVDKMLAELPALEEFCKSKQLEEFNQIVLLGMGGSSLAPLVFQKTFGCLNKGIQLIVLDSTDPEIISDIENKINISKTLFIVSSKSGNTTEVMAFYDYFFDRVSRIKEEQAGENFIAITDKGSPLAGLAKRKNFRKLFINFPGIGGRYSALSYFGIVPAALMGVNVKELLERTKIMIKCCGSKTPIAKNPGIVLGTAIAEFALHDCNKLRYSMPPALDTFGLWLEQLLAESTGKNGKGILPLNGDHMNESATYGRDSFFLSMEFSKNNVESKTEPLSMNNPHINITIQDELDLGQEFFRWEIATATAGAILNVNPFDQPNVQESKIYTEQLLKKVEQSGGFPEMNASLNEDSLHYYVSNKDVYPGAEKTNGKLLLENFLALTKQGDYISFLAYLPEEAKVKNYFSEIESALYKSLQVPVTTQFGPRYLHSTGQFHKGGPNTGFFIQFICNSTNNIQIPGQPYTFGLLKKAQAIGDMQALLKHERKVILIDLGKDFLTGLNTFKQVIKKIDPIKKSTFKHEYYRTKKEREKFAFA